MPKLKNPDITFVELHSHISAARIPITTTCETLGVSRETWRGWRQGDWRMSEEHRARATEMIAAISFYLGKAVLPALEKETHDEAVKKIRARVDKRCGVVA